jgi:predicted amidohydrolase YtcJ
MIKKLTVVSLLCWIVLSACNSGAKADLLIYNAVIYTVDSSFSRQDAMVIRDGRILATGTADELKKHYKADSSLDLQGGFVYPGFIDAHAHFAGYAQSLGTVNLVGTSTWQEAVERTRQFASQRQGNDWITGRGWDQNNWPGQQFPTKELLDQYFPDRPVLLSRIDGHAAIANSKALELAGVKPGQTLTGGDVVVKNGTLTGLLIDNAVDLVSAKIPEISPDYFRELVQQAEKNCLAVGLTTIDDCGLSIAQMEALKKMQDDQQLQMRLYVLLSDSKENYAYLRSRGIIKTDRMHVRGFKLYGDGALGSRGACLLHPYSDQPGHVGFLLSNPAHFDSVAAQAQLDGFQLCTHAIGDSGNRTILNIYGRYLIGKNDQRWRIEHAQVVNQQDFSLFGKYSIIPSVQPTHATSDMYWAGDRLGAERLKGAYAYKQLLEENGWMPLGTDFPVEDISPFKTFYAAVVRQDAKGWPEGGFQRENALTREQALRGMTIWAAKANFEEKEKGSLEKGKWADFVVLDKDLMQAPENELLKIQVRHTFLGGKKLYSR